MLDGFAAGDARGDDGGDGGAVEDCERGIEVLGGVGRVEDEGGLEGEGLGEGALKVVESGGQGNSGLG